HHGHGHHQAGRQVRHRWHVHLGDRRRCHQQDRRPRAVCLVHLVGP
ncbi:hypothetical protein BN1723_020684, partial [Verticillium longisporum]